MEVEDLLQGTVHLTNEGLDATIESCTFPTSADRYNVFFAADRFHLSVHEGLGVVVVAPYAAVVSLGWPLECLKPSDIDEDFVVFHQLGFDVTKDSSSISNAFGSFGCPKSWAIFIFVYFIPVALIKLFL
jgi:hypothetical protein